ncbi:MAG TPA: transglycosylase domain-containing protein, partial [Phototrophicaceae bacterium]|nr:transglycosylase domain-containing protein [Phototrophicaceae bacterium]
MSDRPPRKTDKLEGESAPPPSGGWRTPQTPGTWRKPEKASGGGWQVPALPTELDAEPSSTGAWHLPKPEHTTFSPDDKLQVVPPTDQVLAPDLDATPAAASTPVSPSGIPAAAAPLGATLSPEDELLNIVSNAADEAQRQREADQPKTVTPEPRAPEDVLFMLDKLDDDDTDDGDTFSMSELVALASLVDEEPKSGLKVTPGASAPVIAPVLPPPTGDDSKEIKTSDLSPAEKAILQQTQAGKATSSTPAVDPGEYARQQLAALEGGSSTMYAGTAAPVTGDTPVDPAEYARQQLAALEGGQTGSTSGGLSTLPVTQGAQIPLPAVAVDPRQEELARRFTETEDEVHSLRNMLQSGQINQQQFEEQLRSLMILDDDQVWWMVGAETDTWYKYVNNEWVLATPPRPAGGSGYTLPRLESQPQPAVGTAAASLDEFSEFGQPVADPFAPIPRAGVSTNDLNMTQVGPSYLKTELTGMSPAATVQNAGYGNVQPTVQGATIQNASAAAYGSIQSPVDISQPPSLGEIEPEAPTYEEAASAYNSNLVRNLVFGGLAVLALVIIAVTGGIFFILSQYNGVVSKYEANIVQLANYKPAFQTVTIQDYQGRELAKLSQSGEERIQVNIAEVSPYLIHAIVSVKNPTFFEDPGWDLSSTVGAYLNPGSISAPENTITQQIARQLVVQDSNIPDSEVAIVAGELTRRYDKNFILQLYLNESSFGNQTYGVEAAAQFYFKKSAKDLNMSESAMLATVLEDPENNNLVAYPNETFAQFEQTLETMAQVGCLTFASGQQVCVSQSDLTSPQTINDKARVRDPRRYKARKFETKYPHFITLVQQQLETAFSPGVLYSSGFVVKTTLVPELQDFVQ